nr:PREDICTED: uncharacterized protein LOC103278447 [Anolis carolinensis]|eukprot:XP_016848182.1 PREDICTED: uncharacterized protein LOC103278447 [Anolis carolinensis]
MVGAAVLTASSFPVLWVSGKWVGGGARVLRGLGHGAPFLGAERGGDALLRGLGGCGAGFRGASLPECWRDWGAVALPWIQCSQGIQCGDGERLFFHRPHTTTPLGCLGLAMPWGRKEKGRSLPRCPFQPSEGQGGGGQRGAGPSTGKSGEVVLLRPLASAPPPNGCIGTPATQSSGQPPSCVPGRPPCAPLSILFWVPLFFLLLLPSWEVRGEKTELPTFSATAGLQSVLEDNVSPAFSATIIIIVTVIISGSAYLCFLKYICAGCCKSTQTTASK